MSKKYFSTRVPEATPTLSAGVMLNHRVNGDGDTLEVILDRNQAIKLLKDIETVLADQDRDLVEDLIGRKI